MKTANKMKQLITKDNLAAALFIMLTITIIISAILISTGVLDVKIINH